MLPIWKDLAVMLMQQVHDVKILSWLYTSHNVSTPHANIRTIRTSKASVYGGWRIVEVWKHQTCYIIMYGYVDTLDYEYSIMVKFVR